MIQNHNLSPPSDRDSYEPFLDETQAAGIPLELLADVTDTSMQAWLDPENLGSRERGAAVGYQLIRSIDGGAFPGIEVTLATVTSDKSYPPHRHFDSDAVFIIVNGSATLLSDEPDRKVGVGDIIPIPRRMAHGFGLGPGEELTWVSIQYLPIYDTETGLEDLHFDAGNPGLLLKYT